MKDFFIVSHKYVSPPNREIPADPQLFTKSWHLNDIIKKLLMPIEQPVTPGVYNVLGDTLYTPNTDDTTSYILNLNSGLGVVSSDTLDLDR